MQAEEGKTANIVRALKYIFLTEAENSWVSDSFKKKEGKLLDLCILELSIV